MGLSMTHILLIGLAAMILFGPSRLPGLGKSLGEAIRGFKKGLNDDDAINQARPVNDQIPFDSAKSQNQSATKSNSSTQSEKTHT